MAPVTEQARVLNSVPRGLTLHRISKGEGRDEGQPLPEGARSHCGMYEADDGGNKGDRSEV